MGPSRGGQRNQQTPVGAKDEKAEKLYRATGQDEAIYGKNLSSWNGHGDTSSTTTRDRHRPPKPPGKPPQRPCPKFW